MTLHDLLSVSFVCVRVCIYSCLLKLMINTVTLRIFDVFRLAKQVTEVKNLLRSLGESERPELTE